LPENVNYAVKSSLLFELLGIGAGRGRQTQSAEHEGRNRLRMWLKSAQDAAVLVLVY